VSLESGLRADAYQRTRWTDGRVVVWLRARRQTGRVQGTSGLGFDLLVDTPQDAG
jgi:hypothetical protein